MNAVATRIAEILVDQLGCEAGDVRPEVRLEEDLRADGLDAVSIIIGCEEEFGIEIAEAEQEAVVTVSDLTRLVETHLSRLPARS